MPKSGRRRTAGYLLTGCLATVIITIGPYCLHTVYRLGGSLINQTKWQQNGSSSYTATVEVSIPSSAPINGVNKITVVGGKIVDVESMIWPEASNYPHAFDQITVESLFSRTKDCMLWFPVVLCSLAYDPEYGYPKEVIIDCPFHVNCKAYFRIQELEMGKP
jgi:hypothetical protein